MIVIVMFAILPISLSDRIDSNNVIAIEGPLSYSADAEILIEELKYRIDTYLG